jgi:hypothetical protein
MSAESFLTSKRVIVTIVLIAGAVTLLMIGVARTVHVALSLLLLCGGISILGDAFQNLWNRARGLADSRAVKHPKLAATCILLLVLLVLIICSQLFALFVIGRVIGVALPYVVMFVGASVISGRMLASVYSACKNAVLKIRH